MSACFAFRPRRWGGATAGVEHGVDEFEDGALIGRGEFLDPAEALEKACGFR